MIVEIHKKENDYGISAVFYRLHNASGSNTWTYVGEMIFYVKTVPILVPFIPLYSVEKYKWLVA